MFIFVLTSDNGCCEDFGRISLQKNVMAEFSAPRSQQQDGRLVEISIILLVWPQTSISIHKSTFTTGREIFSKSKFP